MCPPRDIEIIINEKYGVIGFQLHSLESLEESLHLINKAKKNATIYKSYCWGNGSYLTAERLLDEEFIDFIVTCEGEDETVVICSFICEPENRESKLIHRSKALRTGVQCNRRLP